MEFAVIGNDYNLHMLEILPIQPQWAGLSQARTTNREGRKTRHPCTARKGR
jgi:hypothetical protein